MTEKTAEQRQNFRMRACDGEDRAGVLFENRLTPATVIDYSSSGTKLVLDEYIEVSEGCSVQVAISQGQYTGVIRRLKVASDGKQVVGIEFTDRVEEKIKLGNSTFLGTKSGGHEVSGNFFPAIICMIVVLLFVAFFGYYMLLNSGV